MCLFTRLPLCSLCPFVVRKKSLTTEDTEFTEEIPSTESFSLLSAYLRR